MSLEVEFLAVGDASRAGDAIVVRYGNENDYALMVIDGGTADTGEHLVAHLKKQFGANVNVADVVLTHSDGDHASGLRELLREIPVGRLWMHIPWLLSSEARELFADKRWTEEGLRRAIKEKYDILAQIVDIAIEKRIEIFYPFQGDVIGPFTVLSPQRSTYRNLLPQFDKTPDPDQEAIEANELWIGKASIVSRVLSALSEALTNWIDEDWNTERLRDGGCTSASNESSVVLYGVDGERRYLLTGDAGIHALNWAANYADRSGLPLQQFNFVQIPHHGSRSNVGPTILNRVVGPIQPENTQKSSAFVSAPKDDSKHPRKMVLNAFTRRGCKVSTTQGSAKVHRGGFNTRPGYVDAELYTLSTQVEAYDD